MPNCILKICICVSVPFVIFVNCCLFGEIKMNVIIACRSVKPLRRYDCFFLSVFQDGIL